MESVKTLRVINYEVCIGCYTCEEVCAFLHEEPRIKLYEVSGGVRKPISCFHCYKAPCVFVCPTKAMHKDESGAVVVDTMRCIGCLACFTACPFGIPTLSSSGYATKCDLCSDLRSKGLEPACVAVCPARAIAWGSPQTVADAARKRVLEKLTTRFRALSMGV